MNILGVSAFVHDSADADEKRTHRDGWVEFHNHGDHPGTIWVHGEEMCGHSLADGRTYSFSI